MALGSVLEAMVSGLEVPEWVSVVKVWERAAPELVLAAMELERGVEVSVPAVRALEEQLVINLVPR